jgi:hypothetical protein
MESSFSSSSGPSHLKMTTSTTSTVGDLIEEGAQCAKGEKKKNKQTPDIVELEPNSDAGPNCGHAWHALPFTDEIQDDSSYWLKEWEKTITQDAIAQNPKTFQSIQEKTTNGSAAIRSGEVEQVTQFVDRTDERYSPWINRLENAEQLNADAVRTISATEPLLAEVNTHLKETSKQGIGYYTQEYSRGRPDLMKVAFLSDNDTSKDLTSCRVENGVQINFFLESYVGNDCFSFINNKGSYNEAEFILDKSFWQTFDQHFKDFNGKSNLYDLWKSEENPNGLSKFHNASARYYGIVVKGVDKSGRPTYTTVYFTEKQVLSLQELSKNWSDQQMYKQTIATAKLDTNAKNDAVGAIFNIFTSDQNAQFQAALDANPTFVQRWTALHQRQVIIDDANEQIRGVWSDFSNRRRGIKETNPEILSEKEIIAGLEDDNSQRNDTIKSLKEVERPQLATAFQEQQTKVVKSVDDFTPEKKETVYLVNSDLKVSKKTVHASSGSIYIKDAYRQQDIKKNGPLYFDPYKVGSKNEFWDQFGKCYRSFTQFDSNKMYGISVRTPDGDSIIVYFKGEDISDLKRVYDTYQKIPENNRLISTNKRAILSNDGKITGSEGKIGRIYQDELVKNCLTDKDEDSAINSIKNQAVQDLLKQQRIVEGKSIVTPRIQGAFNAAFNGGGGGSLQGNLGPLHALLAPRGSATEPVEFVEKTDEPNSAEGQELGGSDLDGSDLETLSSDELDGSDSEDLEPKEVSGSEEPDSTETSDAQVTESQQTTASSSEGPTPEQELEEKNTRAALDRLAKFLNWAGVKDPSTMTLDEYVATLEVQYARSIIEGQHRPVSQTIDHFKNLFTLMEWKKGAQAAEVAKLGNEFISNTRSALYYFDLFLDAMKEKQVVVDGKIVTQQKTLLQALEFIGGPLAIGEPTLAAILFGVQIVQLLIGSNKPKELPPLTHKAFFTFAHTYLMPMLNEIKDSIEKSQLVLEEKIGQEASNQILAISEVQAAIAEQLQSQFEIIHETELNGQLKQMTGEADNSALTFRGKKADLKRIGLHLDRGKVDANRGFIGSRPSLPLSISMQKPSHTTALLAHHLDPATPFDAPLLPYLQAASDMYQEYVSSTGDQSSESHAVRQRLLAGIDTHLELFAQTDRCLVRLLNAYQTFKGTLIQNRELGGQIVGLRIRMELQQNLQFQRELLKHQFVGTQMFYWSRQLEKPTHLVPMKEPVMDALRGREKKRALIYPVNIFRYANFGLSAKAIEMPITHACITLENKSIKQIASGLPKLSFFFSIPASRDAERYELSELKRRIWINSPGDLNFASETTVGAMSYAPLIDRIEDITLKDAEWKCPIYQSFGYKVESAIDTFAYHVGMGTPLPSLPPSLKDIPTLSESPALALEATFKPVSGEWNIDTLPSSKMKIADIQNIPSVSEQMASTRPHLMGNVLGLLQSDTHIEVSLSRSVPILPLQPTDPVLFLPKERINALISQHCPQRMEIQASGADIIPRHSLTKASGGYYDLKLHLCYADRNGDRSYKAILLSRIDQDTVDCFRRPSSSAPYLAEFLYTFLFSGSYCQDGMPNHETYVNRRSEIFAPDLTYFPGFFDLCDLFSDEYVFVFNHHLYNESARDALIQAIKTKTMNPEAARFFRPRRQFPQEVDTTHYIEVQKAIRNAIKGSKELKAFKEQYDLFMAHSQLTTALTQKELQELLFRQFGMIPPGEMGTAIPAMPAMTAKAKKAVLKTLSSKPSDDQRWLIEKRRDLQVRSASSSS